ncbi:hypothetical protein [Psychroserpens mesophilus]|uniref:hypothetical protein n=1 Tax=Psychroserpens mesophilus TaxID=325473 RepID=UPI003D656649
MNELEDKKEHLQRVNEISNSIETRIGFNNLTSTERFDLTNFKVKYQILLLTDFQSEKLVDDVITLGEKITNL